MKISTTNAEHYPWGNGCDGWHLLATEALSVIEERMPPRTFERMHRHVRAQQFFYVLEGEAVMRFEDRDVVLQAGEGMPVPAGVAHQLRNDSDRDVRFLVVSQPRSHGDRENVG